MANRLELERIWTQVHHHLEAAKNLLPVGAGGSGEGGPLEDCQEFLEHNELELAFDELEMLGQANSVPQAYWHELSSAARLMRLEDKEARCRSRGEPNKQ